MTRDGVHGSAGILVQNDDYGASFVEAMSVHLNRAGIRIAVEEKYGPEDFDARTIAHRAIFKQPESIVLVGVGKNLGLLIRRLREYGYKGLIYASLGFRLVPGAIEAAGDDARGIRYTQFLFDTSDPAYVSLALDYSERFGHELGAEALIAYNTVRLIWECVKAVGADPAKVAQQLRSYHEFRGAGEMMTLTQQGDILPRLTVGTYED